MAKSTRTVRVTSAQKNAAKALVDRGAKTGRPVSSAVAKIANARPSSDGSSSRAPADSTSR